MRSSIYAVLLFSVFLGLASRANAQTEVPADCVRDIERLMREFQARFNYIAERDGLTEKYIDWPACCPESRAPFFPPDGYYDDAVAGNPDLALDLVKALKAAICDNSHVVGAFIAPGGTGVAGEVAGSLQPSLDDMLPLRQASDFGCDDPDPVTYGNMCSLMTLWRGLLPNLSVTRTPIRCVIPTHPIRVGHGWCGTCCPPDQDWPIAMARFDCSWEDCGVQTITGCSIDDCIECVTEPGNLPCCSSGWRWQSNEEIPTDNCTPNFYIWDASYSLHVFDGLNHDKGWVVELISEARRGEIIVPEAERHPGIADLYLAAQEYCLGQLREEADHSWFPPNELPTNNEYVHFAELGGENGIGVGILMNADGDPIGTQQPVDGNNDGDYNDSGDTPAIPGDEEIEPDCSAHIGNLEDYIECRCDGVATRDPQWKRGWGVTGAIATFAPEFDTSPDTGKECGDDCGTCVPGIPAPYLGSVRVYFPLGKMADGNSAGYMQIRSKEVNEGCAAVAALIFNLHDGVDIVKTGTPPDEALAQIITDSVVADFDNGGLLTPGYRIRFYHKSDLTHDPLTGLYVLGSATPFTTTVVQYSGGVLGIQTTGNGEGYVAFGSSAGVISLATGAETSAGAPLHVFERTKTDIVPDETWVETTVTKDGLGQVVSQYAEVKHKFPWGEEIIERKTGSGAALRTETIYFDEEAGDGYGLPQRITNSDGHWQYFEYDNSRRLSRSGSQYLDGAFNPAQVNLSINANRSTVYSYVFADASADSDSEPDIIITRTHKIQDEIIAFEAEALFSTPVTFLGGVAWGAPAPVGGGSWSPGGLREVWRVRADQGATVGGMLDQIAADPLLSPHEATINYRDFAAPYRNHATLSADGSLSINIRSGFEPETVDTFRLRLNADTLTPLPGGTKRRSVSTQQGTLLHQTVWDMQDPPAVTDEATVISESWSDEPGDVDEFGRSTVIHYLDGTEETRIYDCCGLAAEIDRTGARTEFVRDVLGRTLTVRQQVGGTPSVPEFISTHSTFDADGRPLTETREGTDASLTLQRTNVYNTAGDLVSSTDAGGRTTSYSRYLNAGMVVYKTTLPDPDGPDPALPAPPNQQAPEIYEIAYPDGSRYATDGSGALPSSFEYRIEEFGGQAMVVTRSISGSAGTQWVDSFVDSLGHAVLTAFPDEASEQRGYNTLGGQAWTVNADANTTMSLSGYGEDDATLQLGFAAPSTVSWEGAWTLTVADAGTLGVVDFAGPDRISMGRTFLSTRTDNSITYVVRRSEAYVWDQDTNVPRLVSTSDTTIDGNRSWNETPDQLSKSIVVNDPATGTRTVTSISPTGASTVAVSVYGREISLTSYDASSQFVSAINYEYDEHGRQITVTRVIDPLIPATNTVVETEYDSADRIVTVTEPEPYAASPFGGRRATTFTYDNLDRTIETDRSDGRVAYMTYSPTGQVTATWGFETNPVTMTYDDTGRLETLTTYRNAPTNTPPSSWSNASTTTWNYDSERGWLTSKIYDNSVGPSYTYTAAGRLATRTGASPRSIVTTYDYNDFGDLVSTDYSDATPDVVIEPDRIGRPLKIYDAAGERLFTYDAEGRPLTESISAGGLSVLAGVEIENTYGNYGLREKHYVANSGGGINDVEYSYDAENRLKTVGMYGMQVAYAYQDHSGQVAKLGIAALNVSNQLVNVAGGVRVYDLLGRTNSVTWTKPGSPSTTPPAMPNPGTVLESYGYTYDTDNRRLAMALKDGSEWQYEYDLVGQLSYGNRYNPTGSFYYPGSQFVYAYDDIGNRIGVAHGGDFNGDNLYWSSYTPNALNQYTEREVSGNVEVVGESLAPVVLVNGTSAAMTGDIYHHQLTYGNSASPVQANVEIQEVPGNYDEWQVFIPETPEAFEYDADGNLTKDGIWTYEWDGENRLAAMQMRGDIAEVRLGNGSNWIRLEFAYDWLGRRIGKKYRKSTSDHPEKTKDPNGITIEWDEVYWEHYVYDGWLLSASYTTDDEGNNHAADRSYAWGPDLSSTRGAGGVGGLAIYKDHFVDSDGGTYIGPMFPVFDGNGNVTRMYRTVPGVGSVPDVKAVAQYEYGPFGELTGVSGPQGHRNPFRFSTKYTDAETGLVYYGYRYYSPSLGRWISRDPIEESGGINITNFCGSNPVDRIDPLGLDDYAEGPAKDPVRHWDNGFPYDPNVTPTLDDYWQWNRWRALNLGARSVGYVPDGTRAYSHYREATGMDLLIDYDRAYREDAEIKKRIDNEIIAAQQAAEAIAKKKAGNEPVTFEIYSQSVRSIDTNTENWQKAIGGHPAWGDGSVTYDPCKKTFKMHLRIKMEDFYNFNRGQADIATGLPDDANGRFEVLGWAKSFYSRGELHRTIEWDAGNIPGSKIVTSSPRR